MRVDLSNTQASQIASESSSQQVSQGTSPAAVSGSDEDHATLTSDSGAVGSLVSAAMNTPEMRDDKIASLQQAIANGQYDLDPEKIAASMIDEQA